MFYTVLNTPLIRLEDYCNLINGCSYNYYGLSFLGFSQFHRYPVKRCQDPCQVVKE